MGQNLRLLAMLWARPGRAMSGIIDEGSLLFCAAAVLAVSALTGAALYSQVEQRSHDPEGLYMLGMALSRLERAEPAREKFRRCIEAVDAMPRYLRRKAGSWRKLALQQLGP